MENDKVKDVAEDKVVDECNIKVEKSNTDLKEVQENEFLLKDSETVEDEQQHKGKASMFINDVLTMIMDQLVMLMTSLILLIVFNFLIKFAGYRVVMPVPVLFIIYFIVGCLYVPVFKNTKWHKTIGQKLIHAN